MTSFGQDESVEATAGGVPVLDLSRAPGEHAAWDRPKIIIYLWAIVELLIVTNPWQVSSSLRSAALRMFGAEIGKNVIFRPRTRVKFPWKLKVGANSWIGEGVWIHNQDVVSIGNDCVISQDAFITTGSHAHRRDMALLTRETVIESGAWITARCVVLGGVTVGTSAIVAPGSVVSGDVPPNKIVGSAEIRVIGDRFAC